MNDSSITVTPVESSTPRANRYHLIKKILEAISILLFISPCIFGMIFMVMNAFVYGTFFGVVGFATVFPAWLAIGLFASLIVSFLIGFFLYANDWGGVFKSIGKWILCLIYALIASLMPAGGTYLIGVTTAIISYSLGLGIFNIIAGSILILAGILALCRIEWVIKFKLTAQKIDHVNKIFSSPKSTRSFFSELNLTVNPL